MSVFFSGGCNPSQFSGHFACSVQFYTLVEDFVEEYNHTHQPVDPKKVAGFLMANEDHWLHLCLALIEAALTRMVEREFSPSDGDDHDVIEGQEVSNHVVQ